MAHHSFAIPALDPADAQAELNAFCQRHRVLALERQFINAGADLQGFFGCREPIGMALYLGIWSSCRE